MFSSLSTSDVSVTRTTTSDPQIEAPAPALVGKGGVGEPVAHDHLPPGKGRLDAADEVVAAGGEDQQGLGHGVHGAVQHQLTQRLGEFGAAGLARDQHLVSALAEALGQGLQVRGLARAVDAFQGDEAAGHLSARAGIGSPHDYVLRGSR